jgi:hypothetical protein
MGLFSTLLDKRIGKQQNDSTDCSNTRNNCRCGGLDQKWVGYILSENMFISDKKVVFKAEGLVQSGILRVEPTAEVYKNSSKPALIRNFEINFSKKKRKG